VQVDSGLKLFRLLDERCDGLGDELAVPLGPSDQLGSHDLACVVRCEPYHTGVLWSLFRIKSAPHEIRGWMTR
jgi:hypothetical protein